MDVSEQLPELNAVPVEHPQRHTRQRLVDPMVGYCPAGCLGVAGVERGGETVEGQLRPVRSLLVVALRWSDRPGRATVAGAGAGAIVVVATGNNNNDRESGGGEDDDRTGNPSAGVTSARAAPVVVPATGTAGAGVIGSGRAAEFAVGAISRTRCLAAANSASVSNPLWYRSPKAVRSPVVPGALSATSAWARWGG